MDRRKFHFSLTNRLRATAILPALVVSIIMGITIFSVLEYANRDGLQSSARKTIQTMSVLYQTPLVTGDTAVAEILMRSLLSDHEILSAKVFDVRGDLFVEGNNEAGEHSFTLSISEDIQRDTLPLDIWDGSNEASENLALGRIELTVAPRGAISRMRNVLLILYGVTVLALLFSIWLGTTIGRSILNPLKIIGGAVSQMRSGNYSVLQKVTTNDELGLLSENTVHLANELKTKDAAIENQMLELLHSREEAFRMQDENSELLNDLGNEYIDPLISAIGQLQKVPVSGGSETSGFVKSALKNIEYLVEITEDFKSLVDHSFASDSRKRVPIQLTSLCQSLLSSYMGQCREKDVSLTFEQEPGTNPATNDIYSDPIRIRVLLKNILEFAISNSVSQSNISIRTMLRSHAGKTVVVIDLFDDNNTFSNDALSVLNSYFGSDQIFLAQDEYQSVPIEYRTANRVASSLAGNISINRCLNGGHILSIQFLANLEPETSLEALDVEQSQNRVDVFYFRQERSENKIVERYLNSKGILTRNVSAISSSSIELNSSGCRLIFIELNPSAPDYSKDLSQIQLSLGSTKAAVVALLEPGHEDSAVQLIDKGFTDAIIKPISASHICSLIKANSTVSTSMERIFTE